MADRIDIRDVAELDRFRGTLLTATASANAYCKAIRASAAQALDGVNAEIAKRERAVRECEENCGGLRRKLDEAVQARGQMRSAIDRCEQELRQFERGAQGRNFEGAAFMATVAQRLRAISSPSGSGGGWGSSGTGGFSGGSSIAGGTGTLGLPGELNDLFESSSTPTADGRGRFFLAPGEPILRSASEMPPIREGCYAAILHGSPDSTYIGDRAVSPKELAMLIRADPSYRDGSSVLLLSCDTGGTSLGFAHELSKELGVAVTAPTDPVWWPPGRDGTFLISPETYPGSGVPRMHRDGSGYGEFRVFRP